MKFYLDFTSGHQSTHEGEWGKIIDIKTIEDLERIYDKYNGVGLILFFDGAEDVDSGGLPVLEVYNDYRE